MSSIPTPLERRRFRRRLLAWYRRHGRDLPWRRTEDPYHILVSEIMLQQTQVDRVLPKYAEWLAKYPSLETLAAAPEHEVAETWYPLGYNIRPKRLQSIARESVARYGGRLPSDEATLRSFKGIGAYTAGAIRSFAFGQRAAILDTNVARVLFRVFVGKGDPKSHAMKRHLWKLSEALVPSTHTFDFNQALMDLGAMVCVARQPKCLVCPVVEGCRTASALSPSLEPMNTSPRLEAATAHARERRGGFRGPHAASARGGLGAEPPIKVLVAAAVIERAKRFLVTRRQKGVHLEGFWEFPGGKCQDGESLQECLVRELREELNAGARVGPEVMTSSHAYRDRTIELHFFQCELEGEPSPQVGQTMRWVTRMAMRRMRFPPADRDLIEKLTGRRPQH